ncbi:hypothetical protein GUJ93_ZPchr0011g27167 [Zizania palustris]|uniref:Uncharacterized protein n=1 Tax=Zizania palustris TaxID=103762 RepID=A0A8J5WFZ8_ZIZPA|nr:hypothetical protein GUJ93_ZPchr0011g27167 [Zizania palustris]
MPSQGGAAVPHAAPGQGDAGAAKVPGQGSASVAQAPGQDGAAAAQAPGQGGAIQAGAGAGQAILSYAITHGTKRGRI